MGVLKLVRDHFLIMRRVNILGVFRVIDSGSASGPDSQFYKCFGPKETAEATKIGHSESPYSVLQTRR